MDLLVLENSEYIYYLLLINNNINLIWIFINLIHKKKKYNYLKEQNVCYA